MWLSFKFVVSLSFSKRKVTGSFTFEKTKILLYLFIFGREKGLPATQFINIFIFIHIVFSLFFEYFFSLVLFPACANNNNSYSGLILNRFL